MQFVVWNYKVFLWSRKKIQFWKCKQINGENVAWIIIPILACEKSQNKSYCLRVYTVWVGIFLKGNFTSNMYWNYIHQYYVLSYIVVYVHRMDYPTRWQRTQYENHGIFEPKFELIKRSEWSLDSKQIDHVLWHYVRYAADEYCHWQSENQRLPLWRSGKCFLRNYWITLQTLC